MFQVLEGDSLAPKSTVVFRRSGCSIWLLVWAASQLQALGMPVSEAAFLVIGLLYRPLSS